MFMVKDEYSNIKNLLRVRIKTQAKNFKLAFILLTLFVFVPFVRTVTSIVDSDFVRFYNTSDLSLTLLFGIWIFFFVQMLTYRSTNDKLSVFPQTNNSRFISSLLFNTIVVIAFASFVLVTYLIRYGVILLLSVFMDNVHFALDFSLGFLAVGFFVYIAYCLLLVAIIELVGVILRKWTYYAIVAFTAALSLLIANINAVIQNISNVVAFFIGESSLIIFFIKAIALLFAITLIAIIINCNTVYHKSHRLVLNKDAVIGCIAVIVIVAAVLQFALLRSVTPTPQNYILAESILFDDFLPEFEEIHIDISHIPNGSNIEIWVDNREVVAEIVTGARFFSNTPVDISGDYLLQISNIQGDTLIVSYRPSFFQANGLMLSDFANSQLIVHLDGNVLFVDYEIEPVQVVFLPIWGMARQFDFFRDRNIFRQNMFGMSAGGNITPNVWFRVE